MLSARDYMMSSQSSCEVVTKVKRMQVVHIDPVVAYQRCMRAFVFFSRSQCRYPQVDRQIGNITLDHLIFTSDMGHQTAGRFGQNWDRLASLYRLEPVAQTVLKLGLVSWITGP